MHSPNGLTNAHNGRVNHSARNNLNNALTNAHNAANSQVMTVQVGVKSNRSTVKRQVIHRHNGVNHRAKHQVTRLHRREASHREVSHQEAHLHQATTVAVKVVAEEIDNQCFIGDFHGVIV